MKQPAAIVMSIMVVAVLLWQGLQIAELRAELAELRLQLRALEDDVEVGELRRLSGRRGKGQRELPRRQPIGVVPDAIEEGDVEEGGADDEGRAATVLSVEELDQAVQDALLRAEQERLEEQGERYLQKESARLGGILDGMLAESLLTEEEREEALTILIDEQVFAWGLKADVQDGVMTEDEAAADWRENHDEMSRTLGDLLGYDTAQDLLERSSRREK